jgi:hypothetical protein
MGLGLIIQRRSHLPQRGWPECSGMGGRNPSEYPAGMGRKLCEIVFGQLRIPVSDMKQGQRVIGH